MTRVLSIVSVVVLSAALAACAGEPDEPKADAASTADGDFPVTITSCGHSTTLTAPVEHAVTLNQGATEVALALGVQAQMAGTAYLDDAVPASSQAAYDSVPVLSKEYPSQERFLAAMPDFAYASYASAFDKKTIGTQQDLEKEGIASYLSPFACAEDSQRPDASFDAVWDEVAAVGAAFGVPERAEELEAEQREELAGLRSQDVGAGTSVFWYDSGDKTPYVGAGTGGPRLVLDAVGATNIFADVAGNWADASWEKVVQADPDVIVLADASWSTAKEKRAYLESDPLLSQLRAVRDRAYVVVPFSESTVGIRLVDGARSVAEQLAALQQ